MGRYSTTMREATTKPKGLHPVWRGIGCMTIILIPVLSYAAASVTLPMLEARGLIPYGLRATSELPDWLWDINPTLAGGIQGLLRNPDFYPMAILTLLYMMIMGSLFSIVYSLLYRMVSPKRYGPTDAPPIRVKTKRYRR